MLLNSYLKRRIFGMLFLKEVSSVILRVYLKFKLSKCASFSNRKYPEMYFK